MIHPIDCPCDDCTRAAKRHEPFDRAFGVGFVATLIVLVVLVVGFAAGLVVLALRLLSVL